MRVSNWIRQALGLVSVEQLKETESKILDELAVLQAQTDKLSKQPEPDVWDRVKKITPLVPPLLTLLTAIAYFIGRLGAQSYYGHLGLLDQVSFSLEDYLFVTAESFVALVGFGLAVPTLYLILTLVFERFFQSYPRLANWVTILVGLLALGIVLVYVGLRSGWWSIPIFDSALFSSMILGYLIFMAMDRASRKQAIEWEMLVSRALATAFGITVWITLVMYLTDDESSIYQLLLPVVTAGVLGGLYYYILKRATLSLQVPVWGMALLVMTYIWWPAWQSKRADRILRPSEWPTNITILAFQSPLELPGECIRADNQYYAPVHDVLDGKHDTAIVIPMHEPSSPTTTLTPPLEIQIVPRDEILRMRILPQVTITSSQGLSTTMTTLYGPCR